MTIIITTTYSNVDQEFLDDWLGGLGKTPGLEVVSEELNECGHAVYCSKDPTSECTGKTEYWIDK